MIKKYFFGGIALASGVILADQYTKWLMVENFLRKVPAASGFAEWLVTGKKMAFSLEEYEAFKTVAVMPSLDFVMVWNRGISFGMLPADSSFMTSALIASSTVIALLLGVWLALAKRKTIALSLSLIIGGALANVLDRVRFGAVADFIDVHAGIYHWPAFNLADSCITIGAGILIIDSFFNREMTELKGNDKTI